MWNMNGDTGHRWCYIPELSACRQFKLVYPAYRSRGVSRTDKHIAGAKVNIFTPGAMPIRGAHDRGEQLGGRVEDLARGEVQSD